MTFGGLVNSSEERRGRAHDGKPGDANQRP
jgi:hypothetical protein